MQDKEKWPDSDSGNRFELLQPLSCSGLAQRYRARVLDAGLASDYGVDEVLLEVPLPGKESTLRDPAGIRFALRNVRSPNVVRHLGFELFEGQLVHVMEFVKGESLRQRLGPLGRQKLLTFRVALEIAEGILCGLTALHRANILHRNITPESILIDCATPKISGFGLSIVIGPLLGVISTDAVGMATHISPEMITGRGASYSSDIWSVGVTLYELFTGGLPFRGPDANLSAIFDSDIREEPVPACVVREGLPAELGDLIARALRKNPCERFASAEEMYHALTHICQAQQ